MNRDRVRKISLIGLLVLAVAAFAYFGLVRRQARRESMMGGAATGKDVYYCPMHKTYHSDKPGNCPICSMKLVKLEKGSAPSVTEATMKMPSAPSPTSVPASPQNPQDNGIFIPPEKQQLIGMRSRRTPVYDLQSGLGRHRTGLSSRTQIERAVASQYGRIRCPGISKSYRRCSGAVAALGCNRPGDSKPRKGRKGQAGDCRQLAHYWCRHGSRRLSPWNFCGSDERSVYDCGSLACLGAR